MTRRTEAEYHIVTAYSTIVAGIFVLVSLIRKDYITINLWVKICLTSFLGVMGLSNVFKIHHSHKKYSELGAEVVRIQDEIGFHEKDIYVRYEKLSGFPGRKLGSGPGYLFNIAIVCFACLLAVVVLWFI